MKKLILVLLVTLSINIVNSKPIRGKVEDHGSYAICRGKSGVCGFTGLPIVAENHDGDALNKVFFFPKDYMGTMPSNAYYDNKHEMFRVNNVRIEEFPRCLSSDQGGEPEPCAIIYY